MKKIVFISIMVSVLLLISGCLYTPATHDPSRTEQNILNVFADDSTYTELEVSAVVLELVDAAWKDSYLDTVGWLDTLSATDVYDTTNVVYGATDTTYTIDTTTVYDVKERTFLDLDITPTLDVRDSLANVLMSPMNKYKINVSGNHLSSYAMIQVIMPGSYDFWLDIHGDITLWDIDGNMVDYTTYGMSPACAMVFKGDERGSVVREHYNYTLDAGVYFIRYKKAENTTYKSKRYFYEIIN